MQRPVYVGVCLGVADYCDRVAGECGERVQVVGDVGGRELHVAHRAVGKRNVAGLIASSGESGDVALTPVVSSDED